MANPDLPIQPKRIREVTLRMRVSHFHLPPMQDALIIGKRAPVGAAAIARGLEEISPSMFKLITVEHPVIEAVLVRNSDLRKGPEAVLVNYLVRNCEGIVDQSDSLHATLWVEVLMREETTEI